LQRSSRSWVKVDGKDVKYDQEKTGYGWRRTDAVLDADAAAQPTTCQMKRPN
jgi:branched-chain amino acid transport system substrate-binding protein